MVKLNPLECALNEGDALREQVKALQFENQRLRKLASRLYANLSNRETILELLMMSPTEAVKDEIREIVNECSELGIEIEKGE